MRLFSLIHEEGLDSVKQFMEVINYEFQNNESPELGQ